MYKRQELEQLDDYIVYFTNTAGETYPIAVDITEAPVIKDIDLNMKDPCYGVCLLYTSTNISTSGITNDIQIAMLKKNLDTVETAGADIAKMMEASVTPELGQNIDLRI